MSDDYHPTSPDFPLPYLCKKCGAWGESPCVGEAGRPRKNHRSRERRRVLTVRGKVSTGRNGGGFGNRDAVRAELRARDGDRCYCCDGPMLFAGDHEDPWFATIEHLLPRSRGGTNRSENLALSHRKCNIARGAPEYP